MRDLDGVASSCLQFVTNRQEAASADLAENGALVGGFSLAGAVAALMLSVVQYRLVMLPLRRLRQGVRRVAEAQFSQKLDPSNMGASPEFLDLALEFNRMAGELDDFYRRLEEQVRAKSRELVQSERLASVGFLAAGVAHEINNPLNIISGYAELTTRQLAPGRGPPGEEAVAQARERLRIIRDEAFRCKDITEKLLSLARSGSEGRETLDLALVARDVALMTRGLKNYRDRRLTLNLDSGRPLQVQANLTEMKQVLLNLTINALESVPVAGGEVCIEGRQSDAWVELSVKDNGLGMSPEVLRHVFEPFFTVRRGGDRSAASVGERGTGLGLSITHAIIESHGGTIRAQSDGPGRGARFTIALPARA
jgi:two-component system, NtrC family, sensor kinase